LNFRVVQLSRLGPGDCIDVEGMNTLLFVAARRFDSGDDRTHYTMTLHWILGG
jgi:hypothetical protein